MTAAPLAWARHLTHLARRSALPALRSGSERGLDERRRRARAALADALSERRRPTRPRMRALIALPGGRMRWKAIPVPPPPGPLGAIVRPLAIATCDMDRLIALGITPFPLPLCFGHECVAEVLEVGEQVEGFGPGDRVVVPFQISCGSCAPCRAGRTSNCTSVPPISMYGFGVAGGHWGGAVADRLAVPFADGMLVKLPEGIDPVAAASVADNVSDAHRHVAPHLPALLEEDPEAEVLIAGALARRHPFTASVSLYTGLVARALGARRVTLADARPQVRALAEGLGLGAAHPREIGGSPSARLVADVSASPRGTRWAVERTAPDGVCSSAGGLHPTVRLPLSAMYARNVTLHISRCNARSEIPRVLELMTAGRLQPAKVTTVVAPLGEAPLALAEHVRAAHAKTILVAD